jgi:hypothetical protein
VVLFIGAGQHGARSKRQSLRGLAPQRQGQEFLTLSVRQDKCRFRSSARRCPVVCTHGTMKFCLLPGRVQGIGASGAHGRLLARSRRGPAHRRWFRPPRPRQAGLGSSRCCRGRLLRTRGRLRCGCHGLIEESA